MKGDSFRKIQKSIVEKETSSLQKYQDFILGTRSIWYLLKYELIILVSSWVPGILGLFLRSKLYPLILGSTGKGVIFGRNLTFGHPIKIRIGNNVIIDDGCVIDAKGLENKGINISDGVYIGRNTIIYCKDGEIDLGEKVNIGHNSMIVSSNRVEIGRDVLIAGYTYIMSGGSYDYSKGGKIIEQVAYSKGPTVIGDNCWIGAKVVVADGVSIGRGSVIGAGAVVLDDIPEDSLAVGIPARVTKKINRD